MFFLFCALCVISKTTGQFRMKFDVGIRSRLCWMNFILDTVDLVLSSKGTFHVFYKASHHTQTCYKTLCHNTFGYSVSLTKYDENL
jgi:hypothetical protein